jgi:hypothetical protein
LRGNKRLRHRLPQRCKHPQRYRCSLRIPAKTGIEIAKLTAGDAAKVVRQRRGTATEKKRGGSETFRVPNGFKVIVTSPHKASTQQVIQALNEALWHRALFLEAEPESRSAGPAQKSDAPG